MKRYITILGAWSVIFPINLTITCIVVAMQLFVKIFNMPLDVWNKLDKDLEEIHRKDK